MLIHADSLIRFISLDKLFLCLFIPVLFLQKQSVLIVDVRQLILGMSIGQLEGFIETRLVGLEVNGSVNEPVLD
jgi:hypothetical protein